MSWTRKATSSESKTWARFKDAAAQLGAMLSLAQLNYSQFERSRDFGKRHGIDVPEALAEKGEIISISQQAKQINAWIDYVESGRLAIRMQDADLHIVAPPNTNDDELLAYQKGLAWVGVAIGAVVLVAGAVIAYVATLKHRLNTNITRVERIRNDAHSRFCADPNSPVCAAWLKREKEQDYAQTQDAIGQIKKQLSEWGGTIAGGGKIGLAILLPIAGMFLISQFGGKR